MLLVARDKVDGPSEKDLMACRFAGRDPTVEVGWNIDATEREGTTMIATDQGANAVQEPARLRRATDDRMLFGVCGGLGRYLGVDPVLVRIIFVLLAVFGGSGVLLYLIGLVAIPEERSDESARAGASPTAIASGPGVVIGAALVALGFLLLAGRVVPAFADLFGPLVLITGGVLIILGGRR